MELHKVFSRYLEEIGNYLCNEYWGNLFQSAYEEDIKANRLDAEVKPDNGGQLIVLCLYDDGKKGESWHVVYDNYIEAKRYYKKEKKKKFQIVRIYQAKELDSRYSV